MANCAVSRIAVVEPRSKTAPRQRSATALRTLRVAAYDSGVSSDSVATITISWRLAQLGLHSACVRSIRFTQDDKLREAVSGPRPANFRRPGWGENAFQAWCGIATHLHSPPNEADSTARTIRID